MTDVYDAIQEGTFEDFKKFYNGDINQVNKYTKLNLLQYAVASDENKKEKIKIIKYLLDNGVDINFLEKKDNRNALHIFFYAVWDAKAEYYEQITKILINAGIDVNQKDKYGTIPLNYAIANSHRSPQEIKNTLMLLLESGSDYAQKDNFNNSCLDYAQQFEGKEGFLDIVKEYENKK